ncbi:MAG: tRNA pseudouridine(55) synthase TruB, partial [Chloroflexia bacterium]|nr:tRNA pseudouridine(55) synthase TruB [Chloroflexia bacterium]
LDELLARYRGSISQLPPMHSAIRVNGQRLYELARQGTTVDRLPRDVTIQRLELLTWDSPVFTIEIDCSKGTYIRSLAHDLGHALNVGAMLSRLVRLRTGPFSLSDAITLPDLERAISVEAWDAIAYHPDTPLLDRPAVLLDSDATRRWRQGQVVTLDALAGTGMIRVYDETGLWLGVGEGDGTAGLLRPVKVINAA